MSKEYTFEIPTLINAVPFDQADSARLNPATGEVLAYLGEAGINPENTQQQLNQVWDVLRELDNQSTISVRNRLPVPDVYFLAPNEFSTLEQYSGENRAGIGLAAYSPISSLIYVNTARFALKSEREQTAVWAEEGLHYWTSRLDAITVKGTRRKAIITGGTALVQNELYDLLEKKVRKQGNRGNVSTTPRLFLGGNVIDEVYKTASVVQPISQHGAKMGEMEARSQHLVRFISKHIHSVNNNTGDYNIFNDPNAVAFYESLVRA